MADSITIDILLFSALKERIGRGVLQVSLPVPANGTSLLDHLESEYPDVKAYRSVIRLAVNAKYASVDVSLEDGDEIALITPVSGG